MQPNSNIAAVNQVWIFDKLKGQTNYHPWSKRMKSALKFSRLWDVVDQGTRLLPANLPEEELGHETTPQGEERTWVITPGPTPDEILAYQKAVESWKDLNSQAAELIYTMCEDIPAEAIEETDSAAKRWHQLAKDYSDSGFVLRFTKLQELWNTTLSSSGNSIETYVANIRTKAKELERMGAPVEEWIAVSLLLNNLDGGKFKDFTHRMITSLEEVPKFDKIITRLHEEDGLLKRDSKEQAMAAKRNTSQNSAGNARNTGRRGRSSGPARRNYMV